MPALINETGLRFGVIPGHVLPASLTATLIAKGAFEIKPDAAVSLLPGDDQPQLDGDVPWDDDPARGLRSPSDFALYKPGTDLILAGHCHAPGKKPVPFAQVGFGVGTFRKSAVVFGDRFLRRNLVGAGLSEPAPFTQVALDWSRAFGGPNFDRNPVGRGIDETTLPDGARIRLAPNVENPKYLLPPSGGMVDPTGFGPIDPTWPQRAKKAGTYKGQWLTDRWPWFPDDFDWTFFSSAPADQYLDQVYLKGDEPLEFVNLDPEHPTLRAKLPGLRARCFLRERKGNALEFREVPLRIDTLFADLDARQVVLTWRGVTPAASLKLKEFEDYFVVLEPALRPLGATLADYEALYLKRRREIQSEFEVPPVVLDPPALPSVTPPSIAWSERLTKLADQIRANAKMLFTAPAPAAGVSGAAIAAAAVPPPRPAPQSIGDASRQAKSDWGTVGAHDPRFPQKYPPPDFSDMEKDFAELAAFNGLPEEKEDGAAADEPWTRERVVAHLKAGGHFADQDLSGLDLSGLPFKGVRFVEAVLDGANLTRSGLERADLTRASLTEAILEEARLDEAVLDGADLSGVTAPGASFKGVKATETEFGGAKLPKARFNGANAPRASFAGCDLAGADFEKAQLESADFAEAVLTGARFAGATLTSADLDASDASGATFEKASARNLRASKALLGKASFRECAADEAVMEDAILTGADFRGARLRLATLTGSTLTGAMFAVADLREAKLDDVKAREASFIGVNLFRGTLERADLERAQFLDCNLYEVEFYDASYVTTRFEASNLKGTKLGR